MSERPAIVSIEDAERAIDAVLDRLCGATPDGPTSILVSIAMWWWVQQSPRYQRDREFMHPYRWRYGDYTVAITVTSTNPEVAFVTAYAE